MEKTALISQYFYSLQGEGKYAGCPSIFLRLAGCNLRCLGFGCINPQKPLPEEKSEFQNIKSILDFKTPKYGCDTMYSVDPRYKYLWQNLTVSETILKIKELIRENVAYSDETFNTFIGQDIHLVITGGEPFLQQDFLTDFLIEAQKLGLKHLTIETNGTISIKDELLAQLLQLDTLLSISPKLSTSSGIPSKQAIKLNVLTEYYYSGLDTYLKFVMSDEEACWNEMEEVILNLKRCGCNFDVRIMPVGGTFEELCEMSKVVADICLVKGYKFSPRLHVYLWKNSVNT